MKKTLSAKIIKDRAYKSDIFFFKPPSEKEVSYKVLDSELKVLDSLVLENSKTKGFLNVMKDLKLDKSVLFVVNELSDEIILASRNVQGVKVILPNEVNVLDLATYKNMVATEDAIKAIEEVLS